MGVFDSITILAADGVTAIETIQRSGPNGPLETGSFDHSGNWVPDLPQRLYVDGFGIDSSGNPYFDTNGAKLGEEAALWIGADPTKVWLDNG